MSEHHRGAWGARDDAVWWPGAIAADQQTLQHHQHLLHQQQLAAQQQIAQQQQEVRSTSAATHQLFSYKIANSFQNPATTISNVSSTSPIGAAGIRGYDYRLGGGMTGGNPTMTGPAPATQWWYPSAMDNMHNSLQNSLPNSMQNMPSVQTSSTVTQHSQSQQQSQVAAIQQQQQAEAEARQQQQLEAHRQHQESQRQAETQAVRQQQAVAEAQARHQAHQEAQQQAHQQAQQQAHQQAQQQAHQQAQHQAQQQRQSAQQQNQQAHQIQSQNHQNQQNQQLQQQNQTVQQQLQQKQSIQQQHQQLITVQPPIPSKGRMPRGKADARPRGRMTAYAFFVQTCREEHKKKHPEENVVFAEFSKKCAERWKTMLDKEKKRFHEMAEKDKKRYDAEMQNYTPPKGEKQRGKKRKQIKDPNAPKRSLSAFFWFCNDERSKVKSLNPEYGVGDIAKELGRRWSDCEPDVKAKYEAMAEKDKARYEKEMTAYKKKAKPNMPTAVPEPEEEDEEEEEVEEDEDD